MMSTSLCGSSHVTVRDIQPLLSSEGCTVRLRTRLGAVGVQELIKVVKENFECCLILRGLGLINFNFNIILKVETILRFVCNKY